MQRLHDDFAARRDRAGQHHVLLEALTLFDRARWSGKAAEARVFAAFLARAVGEGAGGRDVARDAAGRDLHLEGRNTRSGSTPPASSSAHA
jgi:hypothetical protein